LLVLFWGGHAVLTADGARRLFYADTTPENLLNLDLSSLLVALRSESYAGLPRQLCVVDACANYVEAWRLSQTLPSEAFSCGLPPAGCEQFALLAGKPGALARNLAAEQPGLFSRELLALLAREPRDRWPPDAPGIAARLQTRFAQLRAAGAADQTPGYFWYR